VGRWSPSAEGETFFSFEKEKKAKENSTKTNFKKLLCVS